MNIKMFRRIIARVLLMVAIVTFCLTPQISYAATSKKSNELEKFLEKQYGISITLSKKLVKDEEEAFQNLKLLEDALNKMPDGLIKSMVKHFKSKGKSTNVALSILSSASIFTAPANYCSDTNTINLFIPSGSSMWGSGTDEDSIIHEFGHMLHQALYNIYGSKKLKSEFSSLNGKKAYNSNWYGNEWDDDHDLVFVRDYASSSFEEDFAETFAASIVYPQTLHTIYEEKENAPLIKKSEYIKNIIEKQLKVKVSQDQWRIYPQTPSKKYDGKLNSTLEGGPSYDDTGTYQYKITKAILCQELRKIWVDATLYNNGWEKDISIDKMDDYIKAISIAEKEYDIFFNKYSKNVPKKIKRKDLALILVALLEHFSVTDLSKEKMEISDCNNLSSEYINAIEKVIAAGLMSTGKEDKFYPDTYCTYEQVYYAIINLYESIYEN